MKKTLTIIGAQDKIDLPELGFRELECKVDTGAFTSTIHCSKMEVAMVDGSPQLQFCVLDKWHPQFNDVVHTALDFSEKRVRSSNGVAQTRFVVRSKAVLFGKTYPITFTLSNRKKMRFPVLLGRKFLKNRFLVDVSQKDLSYQLKRDSQ
ncbi:MAG: hypothetical protein RL266_35 [Bacteroidota bacterium]|jgi:hypothetical protein